MIPWVYFLDEGRDYRGSSFAKGFGGEIVDVFGGFRGNEDVGCT